MSSIAQEERKLTHSRARHADKMNTHAATLAQSAGVRFVSSCVVVSIGRVQLTQVPEQTASIPVGLQTPSSVEQCSPAAHEADDMHVTGGAGAFAQPL